jgi:hypothetical protein
MLDLKREDAKRQRSARSSRSSLASGRLCGSTAQPRAIADKSCSYLHFAAQTLGLRRWELDVRCWKFSAVLLPSPAHHSGIASDPALYPQSSILFLQPVAVPAPSPFSRSARGPSFTSRHQPSTRPGLPVYPLPSIFCPLSFSPAPPLAPLPRARSLRSTLATWRLRASAERPER